MLAELNEHLREIIEKEQGRAMFKGAKIKLVLEQQRDTSHF